MLETKNLGKNFSGLAAVVGVNLSIGKGELVGLIGPNGAGKTTLFQLLSGFLKPTAGSVLFEGADITGLKPDRIASRGLVRTFQLNRMFAGFSVIESLAVASYLRADIGLWPSVFRTVGYRARNARVWERAEEILTTVGLQEKRDELARNLAYGHQKLLGIGVALAADPKLLMLDEPLAGMSAAEVEQALEIISAIRERGVTVLMIEHNMKAVMKICDWLFVLNFGREIARGDCEQIRNDQVVIEAYLGTEG